MPVVPSSCAVLLLGTFPKLPYLQNLIYTNAVLGISKRTGGYLKNKRHAIGKHENPCGPFYLTFSKIVYLLNVFSN